MSKVVPRNINDPSEVMSAVFPRLARKRRSRSARTKSSRVEAHLCSSSRPPHPPTFLFASTPALACYCATQAHQLPRLLPALSSFPRSCDTPPSPQTPPSLRNLRCWSPRLLPLRVSCTSRRQPALYTRLPETDSPYRRKIRHHAARRRQD